MKKMTLLSSYLTSTNLFMSSQLSCWVEDVSLRIGAKYEGNQILLHTNRYRAVILVESYDYASNAIEKFNAHVAVWLAENDNRSDLDEPRPNIAIDMIDDSVADLELTLMFEEDVYISANDSGDIQYNNRSWVLEEIDHDVAEEATVEASVWSTEADSETSE